MASKRSLLDQEIESWKGFPWALRKEDTELWDTMISQIREGFTEEVELSGKDLAVDPFFMVLLLEQHKMIKLLQAELGALQETWG